MNQFYETIAKLCEPKTRALIACQIPCGDGWMDRTYEVVRSRDGQWMVDFGAGPLEPRRSWEDILNWLCRLSPRDVEMMEEERSVFEKSVRRRSRERGRALLMA